MGGPSDIKLSAEQVRHFHVEPTGGDAAYRVLTPQDFAQANAEIKQWAGYQPTPLYDLSGLAADLGLGAIYYKDEGPRFGLGSFKALGGAYAGACVLQRAISERLGREVSLAEVRSGALADEAAKITLASATDGNHGRSLAWGAQMFGADCQIFIHKDVSQGRADAMRALGANVVVVDGDYDESVRAAKQQASLNGWYVVSDTSWAGYTQPPRDVMAGYSVMTFEVIDALPETPSHVFLQGGVGGLAASVTAAVRQRWGAGPRIVVVEPELAACLFDSAKAGRVTEFVIKVETVMAGLSCGVPSDLAWEILSQEASDYVTIPDAFIGPVMRHLAKPESGDAPIEAGESAVAGLAAVIAAALDVYLREKLGLGTHAKVLVIGSEGVTDREIYNRIMQGGGR